MIKRFRSRLRAFLVPSLLGSRRGIRRLCFLLWNNRSSSVHAPRSGLAMSVFKLKVTWTRGTPSVRPIIREERNRREGTHRRPTWRDSRVFSQLLFLLSTMMSLILPMLLMIFLCLLLFLKIKNRGVHLRVQCLV